MEQNFLDFTFDEGLKRALGFALESHKRSGDAVDISTEALLFGLSQVEPTRTFLRRASEGEDFRRFLEDRRSRVQGIPPSLGPDSVQRYKLSSSVESILQRAAESTADGAIGSVPVYAEWRSCLLIGGAI